MKKVDVSRNIIYTNNGKYPKWSNITNLSNILYKNILCKHAPDGFPSEDESLTSLNWLMNINVPIMPNLSCMNNEEYVSLNHLSQHLSNSLVSSLNAPQTNGNLLKYFPIKLQIALRNEGLFDASVRHEYKTSWRNKPPFSYTTLICMAMLDLGKPKIALYEIYEWIRENFLYYRRSDSSWQNSVRHNLSLKKCFEKVPRRKDERGKGGFWRINPNYTDNLGSNLVKYRRQFQIYAAPHNNNYSINDDERYYGSDSKAFGAGDWNLKKTMMTSMTGESRSPFKQISKICYLTKTEFANDKANPKPVPGDGPFSKAPIFKKPYALSSLNQYATIEENDHVISQMCVNDSPKSNSPTLFSLTDHDESFKSEMSPVQSNYSVFGFDDFDSNTSSSFDTDFSCSSNFQTSSDEGFPIHLPLELDDFLPPL